MYNSFLIAKSPDIEHFPQTVITNPSFAETNQILKAQEGKNNVIVTYYWEDEVGNGNFDVISPFQEKSPFPYVLRSPFEDRIREFVVFVNEVPEK